MSRADDGLDELPVVELAVGDVGRVAAAAGRLGDGPRQRSALVERRAMLAARPVATFAPDVGETGARVSDVPGPAGLQVAGDVAADAGRVLVAANALQGGQRARVLGRLPERERGRVAPAARRRAGVVAAGGRGGGGFWRVGCLGAESDRLARRRPLLALLVVGVDQ